MTEREIDNTAALDELARLPINRNAMRERYGRPDQGAACPRCRQRVDARDLVAVPGLGRVCRDCAVEE